MRLTGSHSNLTHLSAALIENYTADPAAFSQIRATIQNITRGHSGHTPQPTMPGSSSSTTNHGYGYNSGKATAYTPPAYQFTGAGGAGGGHSMAQPLGTFGTPSTPSSSGSSYYKHATHASRDLQFKSSPFYTISSRIGDIRTCDVMSQHRNSIHMSVRVSEHSNLANLVNDKSYRIMVFCSADNQTVQDIAFPHQSELKVNGGEIKANLRGLKGKPGTTRPVDITDSLRLKPSNYNNNIEFTYALTTKKFYLATYLCKMVSVDELVAKIKGRKIAKATVIQEMTKKANDPDVVATSTVLSLKCPLSYTRLRTPCRSILCNHIQCFDASSYLQLQEQGPQWICPICNKSAPFENLAIDDYVRDILEKTSDSLEQVTIEPDGQWKTQSTEAVPKKSRVSNASASIDVDDDISVVIDRAGYGNGAFGSISGTASTSHPYSTPSRSFRGNGTPSVSSREPSGAPRSGGTKRQAEIIDLTLSSDEDDAPIIRAPKRQNVGPGPGLSSHPIFNEFLPGPSPAPTSHY
ncbi:hypothetical protein F5Y19DRAFT_409013 [Xylariaceae sp. FL1651]|nr:hypothetical protein F5Y19DRAFT_409013 [Xylariaceae sp. FL1651]